MNATIENHPNEMYTNLKLSLESSLERLNKARSSSRDPHRSETTSFLSEPRVKSPRDYSKDFANFNTNLERIGNSNRHDNNKPTNGQFDKLDISNNLYNVP